MSVGTTLFLGDQKFLSYPENPDSDHAIYLPFLKEYFLADDIPVNSCNTRAFSLGEFPLPDRLDYPVYNKFLLIVKATNFGKL